MTPQILSPCQSSIKIDNVESKSKVDRLSSFDIPQDKLNDVLQNEEISNTDFIKTVNSCPLDVAVNGEE